MTDKELLKLAARAAELSPVLCYEARRNCLRVGLLEYSVKQAGGDPKQEIKIDGCGKRDITVSAVPNAGVTSATRNERYDG